MIFLKLPETHWAPKKSQKDGLLKERREWEWPLGLKGTTLPDSMISFSQYLTSTVPGYFSDAMTTV